MLLATSLSPIASSAATNDIHFDPPPLVSLTPSSPFSQEDIHSIRQFHTCPLQFTSIAFSVGWYNPKYRPNCFQLLA